MTEPTTTTYRLPCWLRPEPFRFVAFFADVAGAHHLADLIRDSFIAMVDRFGTTVPNDLD